MAHASPAVVTGPDRPLDGSARGSMLPLLVWTGFACLAYAVYNVVVATVLVGIFAASIVAGV
ncbi:hypothetical protein [Streptomyces mesophilus]|uniref:hypothetical protein n=1 Tax=Streptomyces mesophilus TaxID=1775132 RepID=UPI0033213E40